MPTYDGRLDPLTIGAIFVVVFGLLYGGVQFSEGELLPADTTNETEEALRNAVWNELNDRREAQSIDRMPRNKYQRGIAQDTADTLARQWTSGEGDGVDLGEADGRLPNQRPFCTQVAVRVPPDNVTVRPVDDAAVTVADTLQTADEHGVLRRSSSNFRTAMGLTVHDGAVFAVYRSCEQADT